MSLAHHSVYLVIASLKVHVGYRRMSQRETCAMSLTIDSAEVWHRCVIQSGLLVEIHSLSATTRFITIMRFYRYRTKATVTIVALQLVVLLASPTSSASCEDQFSKPVRPRTDILRLVGWCLLLEEQHLLCCLCDTNMLRCCRSKTFPYFARVAPKVVPGIKAQLQR